MTTVAFPLSAGKTRISLFLFKLLIACRSSLFMFEALDGSAFFRMLQTSLLTSSLASQGRFDMLCSTSVIISLTGTRLGVTAKFIPFLSRDISLTSRLWLEVFTTHLLFVVSRCCSSRLLFGFLINFCWCRVRISISFRWLRYEMVSISVVCSFCAIRPLILC